jgi:hypothetical protein
MVFNYTDDKGKIDPVQGMKAYGGVQFLIHDFLNLLTKWKLPTSPKEPLYFSATSRESALNT